MRMRLNCFWRLVCALLAIAGCCCLVGAGNPAEAGFINYELKDEGEGQFGVYASLLVGANETPPAGVYGTFSFSFSHTLPTRYLEAGDGWSASDLDGEVQEYFWAFTIGWEGGEQRIKSFWVDLSGLPATEVLKISLSQDPLKGEGWLCIPDDYVIEGNTRAELYLQGQGNVPEPITLVLAVLGFSLFAVCKVLKRKGWVQTRRTPSPP